MKKNVQAILIFVACLLIVSVMYIGGLISDFKHEDNDKKTEQLRAQKREEKIDDNKTNIINQSNDNEVNSNDVQSITNDSPKLNNAKEDASSNVSINRDINKDDITQKTNINTTPIVESKTSKIESVDDMRPVASSAKNSKSNKIVKETTDVNSKNTSGSIRSSRTTSSTTSVSEESESATSEVASEDQLTDITTPLPTDIDENLQEEPETIDNTVLDVDEKTNDTEKIAEEASEETTVEEAIDPEKEQTDEPEESEELEIELTTIEQAEQLAAVGDLESFLALTEMVENSENTLEQRELIQIAGTMSDTLAPEILFEILKVSSSEDMLKMAVVTLSEANSSSVIDMAAAKYTDTTDPVERDYLIDVIVTSNDPAIVSSLSNIASENSYDTAISQAAINTMAIIGSRESTINLLNRIDNTTSDDNIDILTTSVSKIHTEDALPVLLDNLSDSADDISKSIAIIKALGNYPAKDVSATLDQLYSQSDLDTSLKYEIDKTYEKITK